MNSQEKKEQTSLYLSGDLPDEAMIQYENLLKSDSELQMELNLQKAILKGLREKVLMERLKTFSSEDETVQKKMADLFKLAPTITVQRPYFRYGIAASLLILLGISVWFYTNNQKNQALFASYFKEEVIQKPFDPEIMGSPKEDGQHKDLVSTAINDLKANKIDASLKKLMQVREDGSQYWKQVSEWYIALAYLKDNQRANAIDLLQKISKDSSHIYQKNAELTLSEINK